MNRQSGFIFLEVLVAIALVSIAFVTLIAIGFSVINNSVSVRQELKADSLVKEEEEAVRAFRDGNSWSNFTNVIFGSPNNYYFVSSGNQWVRNSGTETVGIYTRNVVFDKVYRDGNGNILPSPQIGTVDGDTIMITTSVSWGSKSLQNVTYLTNWQNK